MIPFASSIGFKSGEYGGRSRTLAPTASMASTTPLTLWLDRLSITTMSPAVNSRTRCCSTHALKTCPLVPRALWCSGVWAPKRLRFMHGPPLWTLHLSVPRYNATLDTQRSDESGRPHRAQKRRCRPATARHLLNQPGADRTATVRASHIRRVALRRGPRFVEPLHAGKGEPLRSNQRLLLAPLLASFDDVFPVLLGGDERLFFRVSPSA